jgi:alkanesulfonate monooxygenase SsuD/methylene tetrahydromethanopterin reductase-like flavin-dependent oxidoreductase (luciferase family)
MEIAIGLPNAVPGLDGKSLVEFARRAERRGFSSLGAIDRLAYPNYDPLVALGAAAAVTERIRLATTVLNTPYRPNATLLGKQTATLDNLSGGRLTLGVGMGARADDYEVSGIPTKGRVATFIRQIEQMQKVWRGEVRGTEAVGPPPSRPGGPELIMGGGADAAYERAAKYAAGWMSGGGGPEVFAQGAAKTDAAWKSAGRDDKPRKLALCQFALGPDAASDIAQSIKHYYAWLGEYADMIVSSVAATEDMARQYVEEFESVGCDELFMFPASKDPAQVDLLAEAVQPDRAG